MAPSWSTCVSVTPRLSCRPSSQCSVPFPPTSAFRQLEDEIGRFWNEREIFDKSLAQRSGAPEFVFYEGPPTANGMPHPGHCLTRAIKDLFPRYRTMRGYPLRPQGGLGHARPAGGSGGLQGAGHSLQGGDRSLRRREIHPQVRGERLALHAASGKNSPSGWASGFTSTRPTSPITRATSKASGGR